MSKHISADQKLHTTAGSRSIKQLPKAQLKHQPNEPAGPSAGTNSKNQFR